MANPNMTRFKAMSMDEQVEMIEQSAQEALRAREEIRVSETTEAQRRGLLLIEGAQRIIDQLKNDPDLIEMMRIPADDPIKILRRTKWPRADTDLKKSPGQKTLKLHHHRSDHQGKFDSARDSEDIREKKYTKSLVRFNNHLR
jgi:hypothetical protein